jgi:hypothetical protein
MSMKPTCWQDLDTSHVVFWLAKYVNDDPGYMGDLAHNGIISVTDMLETTGHYVNSSIGDIMYANLS